ncbi:5-hydroxytryptamine receptor 3A-like [Megalobrama amblycephala]|uniref:5-hydroxytryptamine receptor 3A-like n=1 Tax=Megalobrama amblycephala TaxID=75352 RepID=UPI0020147427|nr:5-hydroxytryptamine receptor 3A-like [Megalobrama amblycephala]
MALLVKTTGTINCSEPTTDALLVALKENIFGKTEVRPVINLKTPTNINVTFTLYGILDVDEKAQIFDSFIWVYLFWNIEGLSWDPVECGTDRISLPRKQLWRPDIVINEFMDENKAPDTYYLYVEHTGKVMDDLPIHVISSCNMDIYTFPFDIQNCSFTFNSYKLNGKLFNQIVLSRRPTMYVVNLLIPSCFLIAVDLFSFLLPPQNVDRSAFKMTLILGYTVFLLLMNDLLPVTGNTLPLINVFFSLCLALMVASLLETILIVNIQCGSSYYGPLPQWARVLFLNYLAKLVFLSKKCSDQNCDPEGKCREFLRAGARAPKAPLTPHPPLHMPVSICHLRVFYLCIKKIISKISLVPVEHRTETTRCDPVVDASQSEAVYKTSPTLQELRKISHELLSIRQQVNKHFKTDESADEWVHLGQVIDRLLFGLYVIFLSVSFITIFTIWLSWYNKNAYLT